jgi:hypothetical protein
MVRQLQDLYVQDAPLKPDMRRNTHPGLSCASYTCTYLYDPRPGQCCLHELSQKGTSAPELCSAASSQPVMRFPRRGGLEQAIDSCIKF